MITFIGNHDFELARNIGRNLGEARVDVESVILRARRFILRPWRIWTGEDEARVVGEAIDGYQEAMR